MFKHSMEIVHNHDNDHLDWLFHQNIFPLRESTSIFPLRESTSIMSGNGKGFTVEEFLEVHSLSSDQVFLSIPLKTFSKFSGWTFKCFFFLLFNCSIVYFISL